MRGIQWKLLLVVALAALPGMTVLLGLLSIESGQATQRTQESATAEVRLNAMAFDSFLGRTRGLLSAAAASPLVVQGGEDASVHGFLREIQRLGGDDFLAVGHADATGKVTHATRREWVARSVVESRWFDAALTGDEFALGRSIPSDAEAADVLVAAVPVSEDEGRKVGVIFAAIPVVRLEERLVLPASDSGAVVLLDHDGNILARKPKLPTTGVARREGHELLSAIVANRTGNVEAPGLDGAVRLWAFAPAYGATEHMLYVAAGTATGEAYAEDRRRLLMALLLVSTASVVAALAAGVMGRRSFVAPLAALTVEARALGAGGWDARSGFEMRDDEFGQLSREFASMAASLEEHVEELERARQDLATANAELDERVHARTAELVAANEELEAFSYSVSHDLRAPLRALDGFSQALLEDYGDRLDGPGHDYLTRIRAGARKMGRIIDSMLQLSRISRTEMATSEIDLTEIGHEVVASLRASDPCREVTLHVDDDLKATGDPQLMHLVVQNLLGNAWKFTSRTTDARIRFGERFSESARTFFVEDNGVGFDPAYADKLFGAFQRLHANSEFGGLGIGLATVARVVHRHGGEVWAEGQPGAGAIFYFSLPFRPAHSSDTQPPTKGDTGE